jgi:hypothetical protein
MAHLVHRSAEPEINSVHYTLQQLPYYQKVGSDCHAEAMEVDSHDQASPRLNYEHAQPGGYSYTNMLFGHPFPDLQTSPESSTYTFDSDTTSLHTPMSTQSWSTSPQYAYISAVPSSSFEERFGERWITSGPSYTDNQEGPDARPPPPSYLDPLIPDQEVAFPPAYCGQCDKVFHGRYREGNLRRHVVAFHSPPDSHVTKACRVCQRSYKRSDATRKHEWKKHRIVESKPKKRLK